LSAISRLKWKRDPTFEHFKTLQPTLAEHDNASRKKTFFPDVIGGLAVWWHNDPKTKKSKSETTRLEEDAPRKSVQITSVEKDSMFFAANPSISPS